MSGVTGNKRIESRKAFVDILNEYKEFIKGFPGYLTLEISGSFNSDKSKESFGDIDIIVAFDDKIYKNKKELKKELANYLLSFNEVVPFESKKYKNKRYYNSGEIITISFKSKKYSACQIDNIVAIGTEELNFKKNFLDMPAEKQGLLLGLVKTALLEDDNVILKELNIKVPNLEDNEELEFNLSSKELQLRKVTYNKSNLDNNIYATIKTEVIWRSFKWEDVEKVLYKINLEDNFNSLVSYIEKNIINQRSINRIKGLFKSMVSIKSGEIGTEKAIKKQKSLDIVENIKKDSVIKTGIFVGRLQPPTKAHLKIFNLMSKENKNNIIFLVKGKKTSEDKLVNPFDEKMQRKMLKKILPKNFEVMVLPSAYFVGELNSMSKNSIYTLYAGSDRIKRYKDFEKYLSKGIILKFKEIPRNDDGISATKARKALKEKNSNEFKKYVPNTIANCFEELSSYYLQVL